MKEIGEEEKDDGTIPVTSSLLKGQEQEIKKGKKGKISPPPPNNNLSNLK